MECNEKTIAGRRSPRQFGDVGADNAFRASTPSTRCKYGEVQQESTDTAAAVNSWHEYIYIYSGNAAVLQVGKSCTVQSQHNLLGQLLHSSTVEAQVVIHQQVR